MQLLGGLLPGLRGFKRAQKPGHGQDGLGRVVGAWLDGGVVDVVAGAELGCHGYAQPSVRLGGGGVVHALSAYQKKANGPGWVAWYTRTLALNSASLIQM